MKKIALDVDGVLLAFMPEFDKAAAAYLGRSVIAQVNEDKMTYYNLAKRVSATEQEVAEILEYMQTERIYANLPALDGASEAVQMIKEAGYEIYVVTALPEAAKEMRLENLLNAIGLVPDGIYCVGMGQSKKDALHDLKPDVFIDDRVDYLACAPQTTYHLALIDQKEEQGNKHFGYDAHVHSLREWVEHHLPRVTKKLNRHYAEELPLQLDLRLESVSRRYPKI